MAAAPHLNQLKRQLERLRKDSLSVVSTANKIVYAGVQKLADKELRALNDYYRAAVASIRGANRQDGIRGLVQQQRDLLQETVNQVIANARESINIVAQTRAELSGFVHNSLRGESVAPSGVAPAAAPARKAVGKARAAVRKAARRTRNIPKAGKASAPAGAKDRRPLRKAAAKAADSADHPASNLAQSTTDAVPSNAR